MKKITAILQTQIYQERARAEAIRDAMQNSLKSIYDIYNNLDEIRSSLNINLGDENEHFTLLDSFYSKGIKQTFITNAEKPFYSSNFDFHYKITLPKIDTIDSTGSGDAFTAGIIYGWHHKLNYESQLRFASALGVLNAQSLEVCDVSNEDAQAIVDQIKINSVGKKLKQIHDLPN